MKRRNLFTLIVGLLLSHKAMAVRSVERAIIARHAALKSGDQLAADRISRSLSLHGVAITDTAHGSYWIQK